MIKREEVKHVAKLARLGLDQKEVEKMRKELSSILDYIEKLKEVDISGIKPMSHSVPIENVIRKDLAKPQSPEDVNKLIEAAPKRKGRHVRVKAVL